MTVVVDPVVFTKKKVHVDKFVCFCLFVCVLFTSFLCRGFFFSALYVCMYSALLASEFDHVMLVSLPLFYTDILLARE